MFDNQVIGQLSCWTPKLLDNLNQFDNQAFRRSSCWATKFDDKVVGQSSCRTNKLLKNELLDNQAFGNSSCQTIKLESSWIIQLKDQVWKSGSIFKFGDRVIKYPNFWTMLSNKTVLRSMYRTINFNNQSIQ